MQKRINTDYPGVNYIMGIAKASGKSERIYYINYWRNGIRYEEKAGRQFQDNMTPAQANRIRSAKIDGKIPTNKEQREQDKAIRLEVKNRWTIDKLWDEYNFRYPDIKGLVIDRNRYENHIQDTFGKKAPQEISITEVDRIRASLLKLYKPQTVWNILELLRRVINFGVKKNLCKALDFTIEMPKVNNLKTEYLTPKQIHAFLSVLDNETNLQAANMLKLALFSGMRRGELFKLKWTDIDFNRGFVTIRNP